MSSGEGDELWHGQCAVVLCGLCAVAWVMCHGVAFCGVDGMVRVVGCSVVCCRAVFCSVGDETWCGWLAVSDVLY